MPRTLEDWLSHWERNHPQSIAMGLERVRAVAERMDVRQPAPRVITVAGTNGKGSTVAFIEAIAQAAGWKTGAFTSPHLLRYNERIRIHGEDVEDDTLVAAFEAIEQARGEVALTYFEAGALAALWCFKHAQLDLAILEVGLGGRLDAVNIVDADVAVITTVDLDHQDWLGHDVEVIGLEKAGIARAWKPLVLGDDDPPASVLRHAYAIGASTWRIGCDFFVEPLDEQRWRWRQVGEELQLPLPAMPAPVQLRNAGVAIAALHAAGLEAPGHVWAQGVADARIAARMQSFQRSGVEYRVDVGHNPQAARALREALDAQPAARTLAVYGALADKDANGVVAALGHAVAQWHLVGTEAAGPRGQSAQTLRDALVALRPAHVAALHDDVASALRALADAARPGDRVLVFGSFHVAEHALKHFAAEGWGEAASL